ncbi:MAG: helix-turn-helix domain-containing protein [Bdellovibrionales bacterium]|jgi:transcriptional regulator with XRE-family HTH domain|nr:helix-turn-helix domain-containing protein [Bdellovibrionales bacterium]
MENVSKKSLAKSPNWVGSFIRQKREAKGLSQKELGQKFEPAVTTQFVSNLERGITPIPAVHIQALVRSLEINEAELMVLMEKEYAAKLTNKIAGHQMDHGENSPAVLVIARQDEEFFKWVVQSFNNLSDVDRAQFKAQLKSWFELSLKRA